MRIKVNKHDKLQSTVQILKINKTSATQVTYLVVSATGGTDEDIADRNRKAQ